MDLAYWVPILAVALLVYLILFPPSTEKRCRESFNVGEVASIQLSFTQSPEMANARVLPKDHIVFSIELQDAGGSTVYTHPSKVVPDSWPDGTDQATITLSGVTLEGAFQASSDTYPDLVAVVEAFLLDIPGDTSTVYDVVSVDAGSGSVSVPPETLGVTSLGIVGDVTISNVGNFLS